jgi:magnesium transporter
VVRLRLVSPREAAARLKGRARREPDAVAAHLRANPAEWQALVDADPHDAADIVEELGEDRAPELIGLIDPADAGPLLEEMRDDLAVDLMLEMGPATVASILEAMSADEAADLLIAMDEDDRDEFLGSLDSEVGENIRSLLRYPTDSAGGLMTTEYAALPAGMTAGEALEAIRNIHEELESLPYVYVVDDLGRLSGVISFRDLVFRRPGVGLDEVMIPHPIAVNPLTDREDVAELAQRYNLTALPVVDQRRRLIGVVPTDAVFESIQSEASEDFAAAMGAGAEETVYSPIPASVRSRFPWLLLNLVLAFIVTLTMTQFEEILISVPILAVLLPIVALLGGNAGAQSLAVTIRALSTDDVPRTEIAGILGRQALIGLANGLMVGTAAGVTSGLYIGVIGEGDAVGIGVVVAIAAVTNLVVATASGAAIPLTLRALGLDPALGSNILLTLITDLVGFAGFLAVATLLL